MEFPYTKWLTVAFATRIIIAMPLNLFIALSSCVSSIHHPPSQQTANSARQLLLFLVL